MDNNQILKINGYPIILGKGVDKGELKACGFRNANILFRMLVRVPTSVQLYRCPQSRLDYFKDDFGGSIPSGIGSGEHTYQKYKTCSYLWYSGGRLIRATFQILQNEVVAKRSLKEFETSLARLLGSPLTEKEYTKLWDLNGANLICEYPYNMNNGYIHLKERVIK